MATAYYPPSIEEVPDADGEHSGGQLVNGRESIVSVIADRDAEMTNQNGDEVRSRPRSNTVRRSPKSSPDFTPTEVPAYKSSEGEHTEGTFPAAQAVQAPAVSQEHDTAGEPDMADGAVPEPTSPTTMSTLTNFTSSTTRTTGSGSSSGSASTITQGSYTRRGPAKDRERVRLAERRASRSRSPQSSEAVDVMSFLEPDSPAVTEEIIQQTVGGPSRWGASVNDDSPSARSTTSSSSFTSEVFSEPLADHETDRSSSPEHSVDGDASSAKLPSPQSAIASRSSSRPRQRTPRSYGTPEMPRGPVNHPHLPPNALQPRLPPMPPGHVKHLPRAEKLPLTGYELLASKLSAGSPGGATLKPIYRRFEALNHRLLLHLQDELSELEEQLHRLDTADTQRRRAQDCILPASRRSDFLAGGELQWHKTDILGKVGFKLGQYNHVLASFTETQNLPSPSLSDVHDYRSYLTSYRPIAEIETRFLDPVDDLVSLASRSSSHFDSPDEDPRTPMPRALDGPFPPSSPSASEAGSISSCGHTSIKPIPSRVQQRRASEAANPRAGEPTLPHLVVGMAVAVLLPMATFAFLPSFGARMAVVVLVGLSVLGGLIRAGRLHFAGDKEGTAKLEAKDWLLCAGVYGGVMAVVARLVA